MQRLLRPKVLCHRKQSRSCAHTRLGGPRTSLDADGIHDLDKTAHGRTAGDKLVNRQKHVRAEKFSVIFVALGVGVCSEGSTKKCQCLISDSIASF